MLYFTINLLSIFIFIGIAYAFSNNRSQVNWLTIGKIVLLEIVLAWFFIQFAAGQHAIEAVAGAFAWLVNIAQAGIGFALPDWLQPTTGQPNFVTTALLPMLLIVPLFDVLNYLGVLPFIVKWIGRGLSFVTGQAKFESFFAVEMMILGQNEALPISKGQLNAMTKQRNYTIALMSMSCVSASVIGAYTTMLPGQYVLTAIPLNVLGAIIMSSILNPVEVAPEDDVVVSVHTDGHREPFFSYLGDSIINAGKLVLIIAATVIAFVSLAALIDNLFALTGLKWLSLQNIMGAIMFPFAWLLGFNPEDAFKIAQYMGTKLVTNEFVVMGDISEAILAGKGLFANAHATVVLAVFLTSFANFGTVGMIIGAFKSLVSKEKSDYVAAHVPQMLLSGILVSLLSAAVAGLFVW